MDITPCISIKHLVMGPIENNVYIVSDDSGCMVVDPSAGARHIVEALDGRALDAIVFTHAHWDHINAANKLRELTGAPTIASTLDAPFAEGKKRYALYRPFKACPVDRTVSEGDFIEVGNMKWRVIDTPGHTPGGICLFLDPAYGTDPEGAPVLLSGDTLFYGTHGRTDFYESDPAAMSASLKKLAELPDETLVLPGHEAFTTIARERSWLERGGICR